MNPDLAPSPGLQEDCLSGGPPRSSMRALVARQRVVRLAELRTPQNPDSSEVLIEVAVAGLCRTDLYVADGLLGDASQARTLGHEFAGRVVACGSAVDTFLRGDRVAVMPILACATCPECTTDFPQRCRNSTMLGVDIDGAFAEYVVVPSRALYALPESLPMLHGAYAEPVCAALAVLDTGIRPEDRGLIYGDNRIAQLTKRILNAEGFVNIELRDAAAERNRFDFAIECGANTAAMTNIIRAVRPGGLIILKSRNASLTTAIDLKQAVEKELRLQGAHYGCFEQAIELLASGKLHLEDLIAEPVGLEDFQRVFQAEREGEAQKQFFQMIPD